MIQTFKDRALAALWSAERSKTDKRFHARILVRLDAVNVATDVQQLNLPGYDFHVLRGFSPPRYTIHVNGPWCLTFEFRDGDALRVAFEQYHEEVAVTDIAARRDPDRCPSHPGAVLSDLLADVSVSKSEIAARLGISRQQLHAILAERKPLSPTVAVKVGRLFGGGTLLWVRLQAAYDAWQADRTVDVAGIEPLVAA